MRKMRRLHSKHPARSPHFLAPILFSTLCLAIGLIVGAPTASTSYNTTFTTARIAAVATSSGITTRADTTAILFSTFELRRVGAPVWGGLLAQCDGDSRARAAADAVLGYISRVPAEHQERSPRARYGQAHNGLPGARFNRAKFTTY